MARMLVTLLTIVKQKSSALITVLINALIKIAQNTSHAYHRLKSLSHKEFSMTPSRPAAPAVSRPQASLRLSRQVLAYLRAVAEGVPSTTAARTYLVDDGRSAEAAHQAAIQSAVLIAQRARLGPQWRLLRSTGQAIPAGAPLPSPSSSVAAIPSLEEWAESEGLADWSIDELQVLYAERFPPKKSTGLAAARASRKAGQADRLRRARLALLTKLEAYAVEAPALSDPVAGWFEEELASRLEVAGFHTLAEIRSAIALGGRWWRGIRAFGPIKARDLAVRLQALVGVAPRWSAARLGPKLAGRTGPNRGTAPQINAPHDYAAIDAWISARTRSAQTARAYRREAERFLLWLLAERGRAMSAANVDDCRAYMDFLAQVPSEWISKRVARRLAPGWAPFTSQPSVDSQRYALTVTNALFAWLVEVDYLQANPWRPINLRLPDDPARMPATSRAFSPAAWRALFAHLPALAPAAAARMRWLLVFAQATGLRAAELLRARCADLQLREDGYWLHVHGKGAKNRLVPVPAAALEETRAYFETRGLQLGAVHPNTPLLACLVEPEKPGDDDLLAPGEKTPKPPAEDEHGDAERAQRGYITYATLAAAMKRFVAAALAAAPLRDLSLEERAAARRASLHWLRHTHATRAAEADVPVDVLQANLGQADPRTTAGYYRAQERRRRAAMESVFSEAL
jgi:integrase